MKKLVLIPYEKYLRFLRQETSNTDIKPQEVTLDKEKTVEPSDIKLDKNIILPHIPKKKRTKADVLLQKGGQIPPPPPGIPIETKRRRLNTVSLKIKKNKSKTTWKDMWKEI